MKTIKDDLETAVYFASLAVIVVIVATFIELKIDLSKIKDDGYYTRQTVDKYECKGGKRK